MTDILFAERRIVWLRKPNLCWVMEDVAPRPLDDGLPGALDREGCEIIAYSVGTAPGTDAEMGGIDTHVLRTWYLDRQAEHHAFPTYAINEKARMIASINARMPSTHPQGRSFRGEVNLAAEHARWQSISSYWASLAAVANGTPAASLLDLTLAAEIEVVPIVKHWRKLEWCLECVVTAYGKWQRDTWAGKIILAHSVAGTTHQRLWYLPSRSSVDRTAPPYAISPASVAVGRTSRPAKRRWFGVPKSVRAEL